ncbi:hypothetical protein TRIP_B200568 [uncultured Desulfatiglans sp.]|nr:hypothetical protein TRIP_B200568 [uncultured Desulfatiglans sp.]
MEVLMGLIHKRSDGRFSSGLGTGVVWRVQVWNLVAIDDGFDNSRRDRARHAGERIDIHHTVESAFCILDNTGYAQAGFSPYIEAEQVCVPQQLVQMRDAMVLQQVDPAPCKTVDLPLTILLIEQIPPIAHDSVESLFQGGHAELAQSGDEILPGFTQTVVTRIVHPFGERCVHHLPAVPLDQPDQILVGLHVGAQIDLTHQPNQRLRRDGRIDQAASLLDDLPEPSQDRIEILLRGMPLESLLHPLHGLLDKGIRHTRSAFIRSNAPQKAVENIPDDHRKIRRFAQVPHPMALDQPIERIPVLGGQRPDPQTLQIGKRIQYDALILVVHAETAGAIRFRHEIDVIIGLEGISKPLFFLFHVVQNVSRRHLTGETFLPRGILLPEVEPLECFHHLGTDAETPKGRRQEMRTDPVHLGDQKGLVPKVHPAYPFGKRLKPYHIGSCILHEIDSVALDGAFFLFRMETDRCPSGKEHPARQGFQSGNEDFSSHPSGAQSHRFAAGPGLAHIKEIQRLRRGNLVVAAQANVQIDAEIGQKDHFRTETNWLPCGPGRR